MCLLLSCTGSEIVKPTAEQTAWADAEIGVIITYDINIYAPQTFKYNDAATLPGLEVFNPKKLDTDQWLESAAALGAKYAVLVAKHGTGFCLWPSKANPYHVGNTPWRNGQGDIVADFIRSCEKYGIKPGMYYHTNANTYYGAEYTKLSPEKRSHYNQIVKQQLTELWTNYGSYFEIWFDGGVMADEEGGIASDVNKLIRTYQPDAVLFQGPSGAKNLIRWIGNENGKAPYPNWSTINATTASDGRKEIKNLGGSPDGKIWCPAEADFPNRKKSSWNGGWLWHANEEEAIFPAEEIVERYYTSVGMNTNMLVGMVIDTAGLFPENDRQQFILAGKEIKRRFGNAIAETSGKGKTISLKIGKEPAKINHVVIQENITKGERVRKYTIEANVEGKWITLCAGTSIGHKRIQKFDTVTTNEIRLRVDEFADTPDIKRLAVYDI
jgi:alpha-L-fucosidase